MKKRTGALLPALVMLLSLMAPAEILADIYGETSGGSSKPAIKPSTGDKPVTPVTPAAPEATFQDVPKTHWASEAVEFVAARGLFNGVSADTFAPDATTTRAQLMTVLARAAKADTTGDALTKGMEWAVANGISDGSDPSGSITREQLVTMLYRYAVKAGMDVSVGENTNILPYDDALQISEWAIPAMQWACGAGIINGTSASTLSPNGLATRAQVAAMMQRFCQL